MNMIDAIILQHANRIVTHRPRTIHQSNAVSLVLFIAMNVAMHDYLNTERFEQLQHFAPLPHPHRF